MPGLARLDGRRDAGGPAADDHDADPPLARLRARQRQLTARARILSAGDGRRRVVVGDAGVARDAPDDPFEVALAGLPGRSGSVMSARVMPTASARPSPSSRSASSGSTIREVAMSGGRPGTARSTRRSRSRRRAAAARSRSSRGRSTSLRAPRGGSRPDRPGRLRSPAQRGSRPRADPDRDPAGRLANCGQHRVQEGCRFRPVVRSPVELGREKLRDQVPVRG